MSGLGFRVKFVCVIEISVQWSVGSLATAIRWLIYTASAVLNSKEFVMKKLNAIVMFGVALLPVPGKIGESQFG